jgi:hypothetical protein
MVALNLRVGPGDLLWISTMAEPPRIARFWSAFAGIVALFALSYPTTDNFPTQ